MQCGNHLSVPLSRRELLMRCTAGFGALALTALLSDRAYGAHLRQAESPFAAKVPHHPPRAKNVIFLYMDGGPSQVDTFDPKPRLEKEHGQPIKMKVPRTQFNNVGNVLKSPWKFRQYGESGIPVSDLFPHVARCVDELCIIRSMVSEFSEHTNANYFLHTGFGQQGRPSMGSWITYGLGSDCQDLPGFIVLNGGLIPPGGLDNFTSGFLPATFQGSVFKYGPQPVANLVPPESSEALQRKKLTLLSNLDRTVLGRISDTDAIESAIRNYELAFRMQSAVPSLLDMRGETAATKKLYGLDSDYAPTRTYGTLCLLARRLVERGVRFVELTCPHVGADRWDQHSRLREGHANNARAVDQPIAALLTDLKARGLLDETIVLWGGEFGRTPMAQGTDGRDHNPFGFTMWLAGGGVKGGMIYGATDEYGYFAVENKVEIHDLHATILHLLGIDHTRLTVRFGGRDMRLTDVKGRVIHEIIS
ncbi:MAG: sulfatase [Bacteroidia bacterium]|nr:MAG: sulfatase [Bacteroidia bacterium]